MRRVIYFCPKIYDWACNQNRHGNFAHDWRIEKRTKENEIPNEQTRGQLAALTNYVDESVNERILKSWTRAREHWALKKNEPHLKHTKLNQSGATSGNECTQISNKTLPILEQQNDPWPPMGNPWFWSLLGGSCGGENGRENWVKNWVENLVNNWVENLVNNCAKDLWKTGWKTARKTLWKTLRICLGGFV